MAEGDCHGAGIPPDAWGDRPAVFRQFQGCALQQAEPAQVVLLPLAAQGDGDARAADVAGMDQHFGQGEPAVFRLEVADHMAADADRLTRIKAVGQRGRAAVQRHGRGEELEDRAHFVDAQTGPVEALRLVGLCRRGGVEGGQGDHREHFAAVDVEHDGRTADRLELLDRLRHFFRHQVLDPEVERQVKRCAVGEVPVLAALDAAQAVGIDVGEADHVAGQRPVGIEPLGLLHQGQAGECQPVRRCRLPRRKVAREVDEPLLAVQARGDLGGAHARQDFRKAFGCALAIADFPRIGGQRIHRCRGGEDHAVAVADIPTQRFAALHADRGQSVRGSRHVTNGEIAHAGHHSEEGEGEDGADGDQARLADLQVTPAMAVQGCVDLVLRHGVVAARRDPAVGRRFRATHHGWTSVDGFAVCLMSGSPVTGLM